MSFARLLHGSTALLAVGALAPAQVEVLDHQRINEIFGGFVGPLSPGSNFGLGVSSLGDLDGDGNGDIAVASATNEIWVLLLNADATVKSEVRIAEGAGGFVGPLVPPNQNWGWSVTGLGDVDGDGVGDLAVGAPSVFACSGAPCVTGSLWILFLNADGTVKAEQEITDGVGGLPMGTLTDYDQFGFSAAVLGDLDNDGTQEIAVGATGDQETGSRRGAVYILSLQSNGSVTLLQKLGASSITGVDVNAQLGASLAGVGDIDGDGVEDVVAGAPGRDRGFVGPAGAVFTLRLDSDGSLKASQKIFDSGVSSAGGFNAAGADTIDFGRGVAALGDLNGDGVGDVAVGSPNDDDGAGFDQGAIWILYLAASGSVASQSKISDSAGCFEISLSEGDRFGWSVTLLPDQNGDGFDDLVTGAIWDGTLSSGAVYVLFLTDELEASTTFRNFGANPAVYTSTAPVLGGTAVLTIDTDAAGYGNALPFGFDTAFQFTLPSNGSTLLALDLGGRGELLFQNPAPGPVAVFNVNVPSQVDLCGLRVYTQAVLFGQTFPFALTNAQDWIVGH